MFKKYRLYIGIYETRTNFQICFVSNEPIPCPHMRNLENFLRGKIPNFSRITFISETPNKYLSMLELKFQEFQKWEKDWERNDQ